MARDDDARQTYTADGTETDNVNGGAANPASSRHDYDNSHWNMIKKAAKAWWHHHPANVALDVAKPVVESYTRNHPLKVLGISAGLGAVVVWVKPWRLVSVGGLTALALRSTNISGAIFSMLMSSRTTAPMTRASEVSKSTKF